MANYCDGILKVVTKDDKVFDRLLDILNYNDEEYHLDCVCDASMTDDTVNDEGLLARGYCVSAKWNCGRMFFTDEDESKHHLKGFEKTTVGDLDIYGPIFGPSHISNLVSLAKKLGFGCELYSHEPGICFSEHIIVNHDGEVIVNDTVKCVDSVFEDGVLPSEYINGKVDKYSNCIEIYG